MKNANKSIFKNCDTWITWLYSAKALFFKTAAIAVLLSSKYGGRQMYYYPRLLHGYGKSMVIKLVSYFRLN